MKDIAVLSVDTSTYETFVTLDTGNKFYSERSCADQSHSEEINQIALRLISASGFNISDISVVLCGSGPGSFTGLRIGYAFTKGIALALKIPFAAISSHEAAVYSAGQMLNDGIYCCLMDAGKESFFFTAMKVVSANRKFLLHPSLVSLSEVEKLIKGFDCKGHLISYSSNIGAGDFGLIEMTKPNLAEQLCRLYKEGASGIDVQIALDSTELAQLEPCYIRKVAAKSLKDRGIEILH